MDLREVLLELKNGKELNDLKGQLNISLHGLADDKNVINQSIVIRNSEIGFLDASTIEFNNVIELDNCHIQSLRFHGAMINNGLQLTNCRIDGFFDCSCCCLNAGEKLIQLENNYFGDIVTFEDTCFKDAVVIRNNQFIIGCDLQTSKQLHCFYQEESVIESNTGILAISQKEVDEHWKRIRKVHNIK